jgi:hypothetical protein
LEKAASERVIADITFVVLEQGPRSIAQGCGPTGAYRLYGKDHARTISYSADPDDGAVADFA